MQSVVKRSIRVLEEGSRGFKCEHQRPACKISANVSEFSGAMERYAVQLRVHRETSLVVVNLATLEVGRPARLDQDPAALHAKVCNQSRNVPSKRWKNVPKNASAYIACLVVVQDACNEVGRSEALDEDPAALHAKVCNRPRTVPAGRWKNGPEGSKCEHVHLQKLRC